jgi:hypothetical protein
MEAAASSKKLSSSSSVLSLKSRTVSHNLASLPLERELGREELGHVVPGLVIDVADSFLLVESSTVEKHFPWPMIISLIGVIHGGALIDIARHFQLSLKQAGRRAIKRPSDALPVQAGAYRQKSARRIRSGEVRPTSSGAWRRSAAR